MRFVSLLDIFLLPPCICNFWLILKLHIHGGNRNIFRQKTLHLLQPVKSKSLEISWNRKLSQNHTSRETAYRQCLAYVTAFLNTYIAMLGILSSFINTMENAWYKHVFYYRHVIYFQTFSHKRNLHFAAACQIQKYRNRKLFQIHTSRESTHRLIRKCHISKSRGEYELDFAIKLQLKVYPL